MYWRIERKEGHNEGGNCIYLWVERNERKNTNCSRVLIKNNVNDLISKQSETGGGALDTRTDGVLLKHIFKVKHINIEYTRTIKHNKNKIKIMTPKTMPPQSAQIQNYIRQTATCPQVQN